MLLLINHQMDFRLETSLSVSASCMEWLKQQQLVHGRFQTDNETVTSGVAVTAGVTIRGVYWEVARGQRT